jgi:hypothetical protein
MPIGNKDHRRVTQAVPPLALFGGCHQPLDFLWRQVLA